VVVEQLTFLEPVVEIDYTLLPCDNCIYDDIGCCNCPETPDDYCVMGDKQIPIRD